jgi:tetratricopeptide (TPR) repeat protein
MTPTSGRSQRPAGHVIPCPHCAIPVRIPEAAVVEIDFRVDAALIDAFFRGQLNSVRHFCGKTLQAAAKVVVTHPTEGTLVFDPQPAKAGDGSSPDLEDERAFKEILWNLVLEAGRAVVRAYDNGTWEPLQTTPVALFGLGCVMDTLDEEEVRVVVAGFVVRAIQGNAAEAADTSTLAGLPERLAAAVPVQALRPQVLDGLVKVCESRQTHIWGAEYICAVAHALAGTPNTRAAAWADVLARLWVRHAIGEHVDDGLFLTPTTLAFITDFDVLYTVANDLLGHPDAELGSEFERFSGLFTRAGWTDRFWTRIIRAKTRAGIHLKGTVAELIQDITQEVEDREISQASDWASETGQWIGLAVFGGLPVEAARECAAGLLTAHSVEAAVAFVIRCVELLTALGRNDLSGVLVEWTLATGIENAALSGATQADMWIVVGDHFVATDPARAYDAYAASEEAASHLADADDRVRALNVDRSWLLSRCGKYSQAIALLADSRDDDPKAAYTKADIYLRVGDYQSAVDAADQALTHTQQDDLVVRLLYVRSLALLKLQRPHEAMVAAETAWRLHGNRDIPHERQSIASLIVKVGNHVGESTELVAYCASFLANVSDAELDPLVREDLVARRFEHALAEGDAERARSVLIAAYPHHGNPDELSAGHAIMWARVVAAQGGDPWPMMRRLLALEDHVPSGPESGFARGWLASQEEPVDKLLSLAAETGGSAVDLLAVYELANSRDLGHQPVADLVHRIEGVDLVAVLDGISVLRLVVVPGDPGRPVTTAAIGAEHDLAGPRVDLLRPAVQVVNGLAVGPVHPVPGLLEVQVGLGFTVGHRDDESGAEDEHDRPHPDRGPPPPPIFHPTTPFLLSRA